MNLRFVAILLAYVTTSATGLVLMRAELRRPDVVLVSAASMTNWRLLLALGLYAASFGFWLLALARYPLTTAYPVFIGVGYSAVTVCAVVFLDEQVTGLKLLGIACIGAGLLLVMSR